MIITFMSFFVLIPVWAAVSFLYVSNPRQILLQQPLSKTVSYPLSIALLVLALVLLSIQFDWVSAVLASHLSHDHGFWGGCHPYLWLLQKTLYRGIIATNYISFADRRATACGLKHCWLFCRLIIVHFYRIKLKSPAALL